MATALIPSSLQAQITRRAISPRLAIKIFLNMIRAVEHLVARAPRPRISGAKARCDSGATFPGLESGGFHNWFKPVSIRQRPELPGPVPASITPQRETRY